MEEKFIEYMKEKGLSENTYSSYATDIKLFKIYYFDSYGDELDKLIHADVKMYVNYLYKNGLSAKTINRKIVAIKQYNLFLIEKKIQSDIVIIKKDYIKIQPSLASKELPTQQEINKLKHYSAIDSKNPKRDYCFISIYVNGGLRESEMVNIRIVDILLDKRLLNIIGKGNKFRQVIINNEMYDAINDYLEERKEIKTDNL